MNKKSVLAITLFLFMLCSITSYAQTPNGFVGIGTTTPKAKLHIVNDSSGLLIPKYATLALANSQSLPKLNTTDHKGLMIYVDEAANQGFWYYNGTAYVKVGGAAAGGFFKVSTTNANHIIYNNAANYGKNFIVNADSINWKTGTENKMFFNPTKGAFRAGTIMSDVWDDSNLGNYSFASGYDTKASGLLSTAFGYSSIASGLVATAMGQGTTASGEASTTMGIGTQALGNQSAALGNYTTASGTGSTAMGTYVIASGAYSAALGNNTKAVGNNSTAFGLYTNSKGQNSSSFGQYTTATTFAETVVGRFNDTLLSVSTNGSTADSNRLFTVGNGAFPSYKTAFVVQTNGFVAAGNPVTGKNIATSTLQSNGSFATGTTTQTGSFYTATANETTILWNNTTVSSNFTVTLPDPSNCIGRVYTIKKINTTSNQNIGVTFANISTTKTIEGTTVGTFTAGSSLSTRKAYTFQSDGSNWWLINTF